MATYTYSQPTLNMGTDADLRTFIINVHAALTALGLVQTGDTGQVNTATVTRPGSANTSSGYSVWRFDDALQSTRPVYMKLEFGSGGGVANFSIWLTVGSATDGAGTLIGTVVSQRMQSPNTGTQTTPVPAYASGDTGRLALVLGTGGQINMLLVERTRDGSGSVTAEGIVAVTIGSSTQRFSWVPYSDFLAAFSGSAVPVLVPGTGLSAASGARSLDGTKALVGLFPIFPTPAGPIKNVMIGMLFYFAQDLTFLYDYQVSLFGAAATYRAVGFSVNITNASGGVVAMSLLLRYQ